MRLVLYFVQFPNGESVTDFYKVQSMRGVYMASQEDPDNGVHTMITFDRGGEWDYVEAPQGMNCQDGVEVRIRTQDSIVMGLASSESVFEMHVLILS